MDESRSRNPFAVTAIQNCGTLSIYKIPRSQYWYFRYWNPRSGHYTKLSTRTSDRHEAIRLAKEAWQQSGISLGKQIAPELSFRYWSDGFLKQQGKAVARGELSPIVQKMDISRLRIVSAHFASLPIREIGTAQVDELRDHLFASRKGIAAVTVHHYLLATRKVLVFAARQGALAAVPLMPKRKRGESDSPRCKFDLQQYRSVTSYLAREGKKDPRLAELKDCVIFLTNSLIRPSEFKDLRFSDCTEKVSAEGKSTLWVNPSRPKVRSKKYETPTMGGALFAFRRMKKRAKAGDEYLFFNGASTRQAAIQKLGNLFRDILLKLDLYKAPDGVRTLYSLRHTGITWRMEAGTATVFEIARWARTSVDMIEKHYARQFDFKNRTEALLAKPPRAR